MTIETYLADRRALLAEATDQPWRVAKEAPGFWTVEPGPNDDWDDICGDIAPTIEHEPDADLIVALRNDEERQLAVIKAAQRVIDWMATDRYTQLEKVDGGNDLHAALVALIEGSSHE